MILFVSYNLRFEVLQRVANWASSCGSVGWRVELQQATQFFFYRLPYQNVPFSTVLPSVSSPYKACADGENKQTWLASVSLKEEDPIGRI